MADNNISTKKIFGVVLPLWVDERLLSQVVVSFVGVVVMVLVSMLFVWPNIAEVNKLSARIDSLKKLIEQYEDSEKYLTRFVNEVDDDSLRKLYLTLPSDFSPEFILASLRNLAATNGVNLVSYAMKGGVLTGDEGSLTNGKQVMSLKPHQMSVTFSGDSSSLIKMLDGLSTTYPYSTITKLTLSEVSRIMKSDGVVNLDLDLTYYNSVLADVVGLKMEGVSDSDISWLNKIKGFTGPVVGGVATEDLTTGNAGDNLFGN